jgi:hypothetical protein
MVISRSDKPRTHEIQKHVLELDRKAVYLSSLLHDRLGSNLVFDRWASFFFQS